MFQKEVETFWVKIYGSGPIEQAKQVIRKDCLEEGLCVTIESTMFIYTGGEEQGFVVGLINYPRFPEKQDILWQRAVNLAKLILDATMQHSILIMSLTQTLWITKRELTCN